MGAVENKVKAIKVLCGPQTHVNIVEVFNHGILPSSPYYFIDMELCGLSLKEYIHTEAKADNSQSVPFFVRDAGVDVTVSQIWNIMKQIADGIEYIHTQGHAHRDIKPANSMYALCERLTS